MKIKLLRVESRGLFLVGTTFMTLIMAFCDAKLAHRILIGVVMSMLYQVLFC